jgi:hypothetical protein
VAGRRRLGGPLGSGREDKMTPPAPL